MNDATVLNEEQKRILEANKELVFSCLPGSLFEYGTHRFVLLKKVKHSRYIVLYNYTVNKRIKLQKHLACLLKVIWAKEE